MRCARREPPRETVLASLRFRLTFWYTAVILLLVLATLLGLREGLRYTLQREMDQLLAEDVEEVRLIVARFHPDWSAIREELDRKAVSHKAQAWYVRIFSPGGEVQVASLGAPELQVLPDQAPPEPFDACGYRHFQEPLRRGDLPDLVVRVGGRRSFVDDDVLTLAKILVVVWLVFLVVAPLSGYWLAGRATRPLGLIARTAARLRPGHLDERVPVSGTGDELDRLAVTLNSLLDRLGAHLERQRAFVANAAHELRSPLAALRTSAEVALRVDRSPEEYRELLGEMVEGCERLGGLVSQLLLLAEGEAGLTGTVGPVRLDLLAARAADMFAGVAEENGLSLVVTGTVPAGARGNETHLRQVIHNLLDNAIKFTPPGGRVEVEVRGGDAGRPARLVVRDTGAGIAPEDLPHVFERFYRADKSRPRQKGHGTGLGLSICQAVVSAHGGAIEVQSRLGVGTAVTVTLPAG